MGTRVDVDGRPMYPWEIGGVIVGDPAPVVVDVAVEPESVVEDEPVVERAVEEASAVEAKPRRRR